MATRKDLLKAQSFTSRRMIAAFVDRDPDDPTPPLRRVGMATFVSVLLGVIICAATALFGLLKPGGGTGWKEEGIIISDPGSGVQFIWADDQLIPMANVTSARLMAAGEDPSGPPRVVNVNTDTLKGAKQGPMMGIAAAPRQLPAANNMVVYPLQLCSSEPNALGDRFLSLEFDADPVDDKQISFVARASDGNEYLIMAGKSHRLWKEQGKASPLIEDLPIATPGNAWLSAIPTGVPLNPLKIDGLRSVPSFNPLNLRIGDLARIEATDGGTGRYYVQLDKGLTQVSYLDARLLVASNEGTVERVISESELASARNPDQQYAGTVGIPYDKPKGPAGLGNLEDVSVCATYTEQSPDRVVLSVDQQTPAMPKTMTKPLGNTVDLVVMEPLAGGLLKNVENPTDEAATFLVMDALSYPIPNLASRKALGYGDIKPAPVPPGVISLIRPGLPANTNLSRASVKVMRSQ